MNSNHKQRRGATLPEATMAILLVTIALGGAAQLLGLVSQQRLVAQRREAAQLETGNLMESLMTRPWEELTSEGLADEPLSEACLDLLPDARLRVDVTSPAEADDVKRIHLQIDWLTKAGHRVRPAQLVAWRFRDEEAVP
jgi:hypothetical protein